MTLWVLMQSTPLPAKLLVYLMTKISWKSIHYHLCNAADKNSDLCTVVTRTIQLILTMVHTLRQSCGCRQVAKRLIDYTGCRNNRRIHPAANTHTHTHMSNGLLCGTTQVSWYQKGKTNLNFTEPTDSEWQWHQPGYVQVCTSLQADNHASTPPLSFFTGRMPFLLPNQQCQSTEGTAANSNINHTQL